MNSDTKEAFPSLETIAEKSGASVPTIRKCIKRLVDKNYISIRKDGKKNVYKFIKYDKFEPFSYEFLDKEDLTFTEKSYLAAAQQYMFKEDGFGKMTYTNKEISDKINMSESTISRCNKSLEKKEYRSIMDTDLRDMETGLRIKEKVFYLNELGQAIIFTLKTHEDRINNHEDQLQKIAQRLNQLELENKLLKQKLEEPGIIL